MKLTAFKIQNFRSVKDTRWQTLAFDNITSLIGQNESGKTSILEALKAFHDGRLTEDMLRSDLTLPRVSCRFCFDITEFKNHMDMSRVHPDVQRKLGAIDSISIARVWENDMTSYMETGEEMDDIFRVEDDKRKIRELKIQKLLANLTKELTKAAGAVEKAKKEWSSLQEAIKVLSPTEQGKRDTLFKLFRNQQKKEPEEDTEKQERLRSLHETADTKTGILSEKVAVHRRLSQKQVIQEKIVETENEIHKKKSDLVVARENYSRFPRLLGLDPTDKEIRVAEVKAEQLRLELAEVKSDLLKLQQQYDIYLLAAEKILEGMDFDQAIEKSGAEIDLQNEFMGSRELAEEIFKFCPDFELFEDFSSLLPNRIDLEDIATGNIQAEGYKAAINFLTITGLDYAFFLQPSTRILKQKIENLNGELTLNFQDFWRQNVGKNNKIKINFELAHYDHTNPDKSGKPFIEFWIKDSSERLYPKQRSRGVRWFLSFFLELKATAMDKSRQNKVLLIDEPGVSLHARAQEDVLKVFDDIKDQMQIIYTTHSPHLIDVNKLYRVIAVQRAIEDDMNSETLLFSSKSLRTATADTLSPVYAMMGTRLSQQEIIKAFNNVVVKDLATYYFMKAIVHLTNFREKECYFIPASGTAGIPMIINIFIGWGVEYLALCFGNEEEKMVHNTLRKEIFDNNVDLADKQILYLRDFMDAEDMFSTIDFKRFVVHVREGITVSNSEYLKDNNHSRAILASNFLQEVYQKKVIFKDFDEETRDNLNDFMLKLAGLLK